MSNARSFNALIDDGRIAHDQKGRTEAGTTKRRVLWGIVPTEAISDGPCSDGDVF